MGYKFESLPQLTDKRGSLESDGNYGERKTSLKNCIRGWHHSLTKKHLGGSDAASFAKYHVLNLGWPGVGYHLVVEPKNIVDTPKGKRARIVYANDITSKSYHVGNSNDFAIGICVAGDYRFDELDNATKATIDELQEALNADHIGKADKSHHEFAGYGWKACCVFDYKKQFAFLDHAPIDQTLPGVYEVQQGDTLFGIANGDDRFSVEDLMRWNNIKDATALQIGQKIYFKDEKPKAEVKEPVAAPKVLWIGYVKASALNVRKGTSTEHPIVDQLIKGEDVTVYEEMSNGWLYIGNGQYISNVGGNYVGKKKDKVFKYAGKRVEAIVARVNFYDSQRWNKPSGQFKKGQGWVVVDLVKTDGSHQYKVKNSRGRIYYITARKDLVKIV